MVLLDIKKKDNMKIWILLIIVSINLATNKIAAYLYPHETATAKYLKSIEVSETRSGLKPINCIYVINLDERPEKWVRMQPIFKKQGLRVNRVSAINGWKLPKKALWELQGPYRTSITKGEIGCILSHISVLKDAYDRGFEMIWIFEDDVEFLEDIHQIPELLKKLSVIDPDWDIFYTDIDIQKNGKYIPALAVWSRPDQQLFPLEYYTERRRLCEDIMMVRLRYGMHSVLFSRRGIEKVLHYFTHVYLWSAIDIDIHNIPGIRQYSTTRDMVVQMRSDISDTSVSVFK
jgi:GR25 family glycosyltransferase involved in LPS biosynthesis